MAAAPIFPSLHFPRTHAPVESELDHRIAQFRWNLTWATPDEMLAEEEEGAACIKAVTEERKRYVIYIKDQPAKTITVTKSLAGELLPISVTKLCFKREGESASLSQTYFQGLFAMEQNDFDWMRV